MQMRIERGGGPLYQHGRGTMISRLFTSKAWMEAKMEKNFKNVVHEIPEIPVDTPPNTEEPKEFELIKA